MDGPPRGGFAAQLSCKKSPAPPGAEGCLWRSEGGGRWPRATLRTLGPNCGLVVVFALVRVAVFCFLFGFSEILSFMVCFFTPPVLRPAPTGWGWGVRPPVIAVGPLRISQIQEKLAGVSCPCPIQLLGLVLLHPHAPIDYSSAR